MKPEIKTKWIKALRSGKYEQGRGYLKRNNKYCCLGVLGEVLEIPEDELVSKCFLPDGRMSFQKQYVLSDLNDKGVPFEVIAGFIKENL